MHFRLIRTTHERVGTRPDDHSISAIRYISSKFLFLLKNKSSFGLILAGWPTLFRFQVYRRLPHPSRFSKGGNVHPSHPADAGGEKQNYTHRNPVKRGLVRQPEHWGWGGYRHYACGESGPVLVNEQQPTKMKITPKRRLRDSHPSKTAKGWAASVRVKGQKVG